MISIKNDKNLKIKNTDLVSVKAMGSIYELCFTKTKNSKQTIQLIDKDHYINLATGEIKVCNHIENRSQNLAQVSQSLKRLRDYINTNVLEPKNCKWITLTYKQEDRKPMRDTKRLYLDFKRFMTRFHRRINNRVEYIVACEPQGNGAWHMHLILIFDRKPPYIPNKVIADLWEQGFTKTQNLNNIDNIGAYLTAYLGDMELTDDNISTLIDNGLNCLKMPVKEVSSIEGIQLKEPKKFIKGGRLYLYPPKFNLYRCSRGIKKPVKEYWQYSVIKEKVGLGTPTYTKGIELTDTDNLFSNQIIYEYYNTKRV